MSKRKLATIQKITDIRPIEGKDRIEQATVLGWNVIIGKDLYEEGDLVVFCEIDSLFPAHEYWADLEKFKYRIKTMKVNTPDGPIYGQGYCIPFKSFTKYLDDYTNFWDKMEEMGFEGSIYNWSVDVDVTEWLNITKYEPPISNSMLIGNAEGAFPTQYLSKTDEIRLESCLGVLEEMKGLPYVITMKIDGTSWTGLKIDDQYKVCSRNNMLKDPKDSGVSSNYWEMFYKYPGIAKLSDQDFALQAEMAGNGIQKNPLNLKEKELFAFNIVDLKTRKYVDFDVFKSLCELYEIPMCPVVETGQNFQHTFESLKELSDNLKYSSGKPAEGIVIRPLKEMASRTLRDRMSFKQISRVFLSKGGD